MNLTNCSRNSLLLITSLATAGCATTNQLVDFAQIVSGHRCPSNCKLTHTHVWAYNQPKQAGQASIHSVTQRTSTNYDSSPPAMPKEPIMPSVESVSISKAKAPSATERTKIGSIPTSANVQKSAAARSRAKNEPTINLIGYSERNACAQIWALYRRFEYAKLIQTVEEKFTKRRLSRNDLSTAWALAGASAYLLWRSDDAQRFFKKSIDANQDSILDTNVFPSDLTRLYEQMKTNRLGAN